MSKTIVDIVSVSKSFPGVKALDRVSFSISKGKIHGLVGENGAGKSTLIKIIAGVYTEYEGDLYISEKKVKMLSPTDAQDNGIATIFQELTIIPKMSVAENIFLGRELLKSKVFMDRSTIKKKSSEVLNFLLGRSIRPNQIAERLSVANQQLIEICKALVLDSKVIVMDEPTASLTRNEVVQLFSLIRKLKESGKTILYVSHRIEEVFEICDSITVLRDGKNVGTLKKEEASPDKVVKMMVGRSIETVYPTRNTQIGDILLSVKDLSKKDEFKNISFNLNAGEILGFAGLIGAGRTELAKAIIGVSPPDSGSIHIFGKKSRFFSHPRKALSRGLSYLSEDRKKDGLFPLMSVKENISLTVLNKCSNFSFVVNSRKEISLVDSFISKIRIIATSRDQQVENLSGGNQQKVIISRLLSTKSRIFIFDEPTRGIDVGAKFEIYNIMNTLTSDGNGIIFISSELPELMGVSDRIMLMRSGELVKEVKGDKATAEEIMQVLSGSSTT